MTTNIKPEGFPDTPTLDKIDAVRKEAQAVGQFLEWLDMQGIQLCTVTEEAFPARFVPIPKHIDDLIHEFFDIDPLAEDAEQRKVLDWVREQHPNPVDTEAQGA